MIKTSGIEWQIGKTNAALPPLAKGLPILGNALSMRQDPTRYIVSQYHELGPIFQIKVLNRPIVIMAGLEANQFATQEEYTAFTNRGTFQGLTHEMGSVDNILTLDGTQHQHLRKLLRTSYSRSQVAKHISTIMKTVDAMLDKIKVGESFDVLPIIRRLTIFQQGRIMMNMPPDEYYEDILQFWTINLAVNIFQLMPRAAFNLPAYRKSQARVWEWSRKVVDFHRANPVSEERPRTAIDDLIENLDEKGQQYPESYLLFEAIAPYVAGMDTVTGTTCFVLYALLKHPEVLERIMPEIDALFANGVPDINNLRQMETLGKAIHETLRLYPVASFMVRSAAQTFEFAGYRVDAGMDVYSAHAVPHFLPEFYPDPYRFNIERPRPMAGTFVPFGVGNHACLAAGMAESQITLTIAALFHRARFEMLPKDFEATMEAIPLPNPGKFRMKLLERRR